MVVVGAFQLILDDHSVFVTEGAANDVRRERPDRGFNRFDFKLNAD